VAWRPASINIGTRGSRLARTQTEMVVQTIRRHVPDLEIATRVISTEGDRVQDIAVSRLGDKGVFVRNIESALLSGEIDLAVHSLKDVPSDQEAPGLKLAAFSAREDPRDAVVSRDGVKLLDLRPGAVVGTSSLRRRAQLRALRPDVHTRDIRGNVDTRLAKMHDGEYDALILAAAGLLRLGLDGMITELLPVELFTPDAGQGILAIQTRREDDLNWITDPIDDHDARLAAVAERACVQALGADCRSPVGVYATLQGGELSVQGMAAQEDGSQLHRDTVQGAPSEALELGHLLGSRLLGALTR
jgi:hydroxymethylbilane synthase